MSLPEIAIADDFAAAGTPLALGVATAQITPRAGDPELGALLEQAAQEAVARLGDDPPAQQPEIAATRGAYKALGKDPSRYRPAAEALLRRAKQGKGLYRINAVVDVNNVLSLETGLSIGVHDLDALTPPLTCRAGRDGESYQGIGRGDVNLANLPLLADAAGPAGCPTSDSARCAVGPETQRILLVIYGFGGADALSRALQRAADLLQRHADARAIETTVVGG